MKRWIGRSPAILGLALAYCLLSVFASAEPGELAGKWTLLIQMGGTPMLADLSVEKDDGGKLLGDVNTQFGAAKIEEFSLQADMHILKYSIQRGNQPAMNVILKLKPAGDDITGFVQIGDAPLGIPLKGAKVGTEAEIAMRKSAEEAKVAKAGKPTLPIADAGDFVGEWDLTVESEVNGTEIADFTVKEMEGMATAQLKMPPPIGDQIINNITKSDKGLDFHYEMSFGSQTFKITMSLALKDGKLSGTIADEDGLFELPATGVKKGTKDPSGTGRIQRRPRMGPTVEYYKVGGKKIAVSYGSPSINAPGFNRVPNTQTDGFIWQMGRDAATKIQTDADLLFGDRLIKAGRYGLWAKKVDGGWHLLINAKPDVWGTQHDPDADLAEVPMSLSKLDAPVENLKIEFLEENGAGVFRLTWGTDELKAQFRISQ